MLHLIDYSHITVILPLPSFTSTFLHLSTIYFTFLHLTPTSSYFVLFCFILFWFILFYVQKHGSSSHRKSSSSSSSTHSHSHSSTHTYNENPLLTGSDRVLHLLPGETILDVQFQKQLLPSDSSHTQHTQNIDSSTISTRENSFSSPSSKPLGAETMKNKKSWTSGIGILTSHRVLILIVQENCSTSTSSSTSSMRLCNTLTHTDSQPSSTHTSKAHKGMRRITHASVLF